MNKYKIKLIPRSEREAVIRKRSEATAETHTLWDFRGEKATLKVISLPIDLPVYRMANCRTYSEQEDAIAKEGLDKNYFSKGQELSTVQAAQHAILAKLAKKQAASVSAILDVLENEGQRDPILVTNTGVVVNGNRRLTFSASEPTADDLDTPVAKPCDKAHAGEFAERTLRIQNHGTYVFAFGKGKEP